MIATAGSVNTGAIDDLPALAALASEEDLWLHIDGCIGALIAIAPRNAYRVAGIEKADSLALDPHKWLHAPFEAGCALVRDASAHRATFAVTPEYLQSAPRGLASGEWLHEWGLQTSRGFRALKIWMALKEHGVEKFGRLIDQDIDHAHRLSALIEAEPDLELVAPTNINIVCFRYRPPGLDSAAIKELNTEIMLRMQEEGLAAVSDTTVQGRHCLRAAINNYRTRGEDLELLVREKFSPRPCDRNEWSGRPRNRLSRSILNDAGQVDVFPQEITRALLNLISNGFYAASKRKGQDTVKALSLLLRLRRRTLATASRSRFATTAAALPLK